jgi:hypothetical protein
MVYGLWFMVYGLWFMVYGLWFMAYNSIVPPLYVSLVSAAFLSSAGFLSPATAEAIHPRECHKSSLK